MQLLMWRIFAVVAVHPHSAIAMVDVNRTASAIYRDQVVVYSHATALGVTIGEELALN